MTVQMARSKKACLIFFDEVDAIGGARFDDGAGGAPRTEALTCQPCCGPLYLFHHACVLVCGVEGTRGIGLHV